MDNGHEMIQAWVEIARDYTKYRRYGGSDRVFEALIDRISKAGLVASRLQKGYVLWGMLQWNIWRGLSMDIAMQTDGSGKITELTRLITAHSIDSRNWELWELVGGIEAGVHGRDFRTWGATPENGLYWEAVAKMEKEVIKYSEHVLGVLCWSLGDGVMGGIRKETIQEEMEDTKLIFEVLLELAPPMQMIPICGIFYRHLHTAKRLNPSDADEFGKIVVSIVGAARDMLSYCGENL